MIVEVSQFRLVPGADEDAFLAAAEETQTGFLATQPGFVGRELLRGPDGSWLDIVRFESADAAHAAFAAFVGHPSTSAFEAMLDPEAVSMTHWAVARSW
ncbi:antibiotic biosynthesis monooxygenase family protein [Georgenia sp. AZ-5]|uniref:antibiotic biosynthesis monooxygenase family protein n=1 Tax=Georgenia sp. AZ-5 TaxID=3367526 RepID=UPI00375498BA